MGSCVLLQASRLDTLLTRAEHTYTLQLRNAVGASLLVDSSYVYPSKYLDVSLGTLPVKVSNADLSSDTVLTNVNLTFSSPMSQTVFFYIRVNGINIPGSPFAAVFSES